MSDRPRVTDSLCRRCRWAKDRTNNQYVDACYCIEYGYIVSQKKQRCKGFKGYGGPGNEQIPEQEGHG